MALLGIILVLLHSPIVCLVFLACIVINQVYLHQQVSVNQAIIVLLVLARRHQLMIKQEIFVLLGDIVHLEAHKARTAVLVHTILKKVDIRVVLA
jgi:hypothetical protein